MSVKVPQYVLDECRVYGLEMEKINYEDRRVLRVGNHGNVYAVEMLNRFGSKLYFLVKEKDNKLTVEKYLNEPQNEHIQALKKD